MGLTDDIIIEVKNLSKSFGGVKALDDVNIAFEKNMITGLIGPNGAGKTTLFNIISGIYKPDCGEVKFKNMNIEKLPAHKISQLGIGRLFQDIRIFRKLTALENVLVAFPNQVGEKFYEPIIKRNKFLKSEKNNIQKAEELLDFVGLKDYKNTLAENLSYGQQKLLSIARLLALDAEVLLLDEPASGIHPYFIEKICNLIKDLLKMGKTVIFTEHNMNVVLEIADWVYLLNEGKVIAFGLPQEVLEDKITKEVYLGV